jgi:hypothetical protein
MVDFVSDAAGMMIVLTGLAAGALRTVAVLGESSSERIEWMTALGFVGGAAISTVFLALDAALS